MIRDYDTMVKALLRCKQGDRCVGCAYVNDDDCSASLASDVLEVLAGHDQIQSHLNTILQTVRAALEKGDQHIMVSPDGSVSMWPDTPTKGWISVNDAKPDKNGDYLVYRGHAVSEDWLKANDANWLVGICPWNEKMGGWYKMRDSEVDKTVTHWMELPTAPEGWG